MIAKGECDIFLNLGETPDWDRPRSGMLEPSPIFAIIRRTASADDDEIAQINGKLHKF